MWISDGQRKITVYELAQQGSVKTDDHFDALQYARQEGRAVVQLPHGDGSFTSWAAVPTRD
jgi:hypothetical protein